MKRTRAFLSIPLQAAAVILLATALGAQTPGSAAVSPGRGHFEIGFHYGHWSVNILKSAIEEMVADLADQIKDNMVDKIREDHPELQEVSFTRDFEFDSGGPNYGFELRWYPAGETGSFSLGLSFEKTAIEIGIPRLTTSLTLEEETTKKEAGFTATAGGTVTAKPLAFLLSFRWDIAPSKRVHPYFTFGFGLAGESALLQAAMDYHFDGTLTNPDGTSEVYSEASTKTVQQLIDEDKQRSLEEGSDEEPFDLPIHFMPFLQLHFGLKGVITKNVHLLVDFGVLDGFVLRGGLAIRI
jgi:hypothetical protein